MDFKIKNFTMEKFNNDVNHSGDLDRKYIDWSEYRKKVNGFIKDNITLKNHDCIFVFGAGECNDIDLKFLADIFDSITLSDIDVLSIQEGISRQKLSESAKSKIKVVSADYTGLHKNGFFQHISDLVNKRKTEEEISEYIKTAISEIKNTDVLSLYKNKYSVVLVLPTYTQLAYTQMEALLRILYQYNIYEVDDLNKIITSMYHTMPKVMDIYNELTLSLLSDNGVILVLADILEITDIQTKEDMISKINNIEAIKEYLAMDCSGLAKMGIDDLVNKIEVLNEDYAIWPFDESKNYIVNMLTGSKLE